MQRKNNKSICVRMDLTPSNFILLEAKTLCLGGCLGLEDGSFTRAWSKIVKLLNFFILTKWHHASCMSSSHLAWMHVRKRNFFT
jgi:hypothetical protein